MTVCCDTLPSTSVADYSQVTADELLGICADFGNADAWEEFVRRFHSVVIAVLVRTARRHTNNYMQEIDDLEEEFYLRICTNGARALRAFVPQHPDSAYGYIKVIATCVAHDHFKRTKGEMLEDALLDNLSEPDVMEWQLLLEDVNRILRRTANDAERQLFWLYFLHGLTAKEIADLPFINLGVKGVDSACRRLGLKVRKELAVPASGGKRINPGSVVPKGIE